MEAEKSLPPRDALKTYRYLRVGMILAVIALVASVMIERSHVDCWQTSISAYYYTPVRAVFVGGLLAIGFSLIVIKGRGNEDIFLNAAGMLAPVVAVAPTTDVGACWSIRPIPLPLVDGELAPWVRTNIDNNFNSLLITGVVALVVAVTLALLISAGLIGDRRELERGTTLSLGATAGALVLGWWAINNWSAFHSRAHGFAAVAMFVFLFAAVVTKAWQHRNTSPAGYLWSYATVAVLMAAGAAVIAGGRIGDEHTVLILEAYEIAMFVGYWVIQTVEHWDEKAQAGGEEVRLHGL